MPKLTLNIFLLGALLLISAGCGPKASKQEAAAEQRDPRLKKAEELIMKELDSRFSKTGDNLYTALLEDDGQFYVQVKSLKIGAVHPRRLDEADKLNGITWSGYCCVTFSAYRKASAEVSQPAWRNWIGVNIGNDSPLDSPGIIYLVEQGGQLKIDPVSRFKCDETYSLKSAKKVDELPDSLKTPAESTK